ncbi:UrcA family protein [Gluconobacter cerevisiae]|uniref:UrcA family protein n=1 Tax=Gluconobacter cerevisiae TaxID=1379734 RepID=A0ABR9YAI0_9PROT|nr:UrcA family protein [Gluconobacter cerevisiae]MBF0875650.1 UrcA family protein [Gluconobacter cerevisiae]
MTRFSSLLLCALSITSLALPLQATHAAPSGIGTTSTEIDLSSLDLRATRDWTIANQKIAQASHVVCQKLIQDNWLVDSDGADCEQDAFSRAHDDLYVLRDQQRARHQAGHVILALSARK